MDQQHYVIYMESLLYIFCSKSEPAAATSEPLGGKMDLAHSLFRVQRERNTTITNYNVQCESSTLGPRVDDHDDDRE